MRILLWAWPARTTCTMVRVSLKGVVFPAILIVVAFFGLFFLPLCLLLYLLPFCGKLARTANDLLISSWLKLVPGLFELVFGVKVKISGDQKHLDGPCLIIMNHRTRFDWLFLWSYMIRMGNLQHHKIILKQSLKKIPLFGWGMQGAQFLFLSRHWDEDQQYMKDHLAYFTDTDYPLQLLLFPEGTDLSPSNKEKSQKYAEQHNLPKFEYVLHPRTKGFVLCVNELLKSPTPVTLVNLSVGYVGPMPQNERDIVKGNWPDEVHFHAERMPLANLPRDPPELERWLQDCWTKKESQLEKFYKNKTFSGQYMSPFKMSKSDWEMKSIMAFWIVFLAYLFYSLCTSYFYWWYYPVWFIFYLLLNMLTSGTDDIIVKHHAHTRISRN